MPTPPPFHLGAPKAGRIHIKLWTSKRPYSFPLWYSDIRYVRAILSNHINNIMYMTIVAPLRRCELPLYAGPLYINHCSEQLIENARILLWVQRQSLLVSRCVLAWLHLLGSYRVTATPKKTLFDIPVPSRDVTYQTLPGRELFHYDVIIPAQGEFAKWHPGWGLEYRCIGVPLSSLTGCFFYRFLFIAMLPGGWQSGCHCKLEYFSYFGKNIRSISWYKTLIYRNTHPAKSNANYFGNNSWNNSINE